MPASRSEELPLRSGSDVVTVHVPLKTLPQLRSEGFDGSFSLAERLSQVTSFQNVH